MAINRRAPRQPQPIHYPDRSQLLVVRDADGRTSVR
jgi:hypothetical protein